MQIIQFMKQEDKTQDILPFNINLSSISPK